MPELTEKQIEENARRMCDLVARVGLRLDMEAAQFIVKQLAPHLQYPRLHGEELSHSVYMAIHDAVQIYKSDIPRVQNGDNCVEQMIHGKVMDVLSLLPSEDEMRAKLVEELLKDATAEECKRLADYLAMDVAKLGYALSMWVKGRREAALRPKVDERVEYVMKRANVSHDVAVKWLFGLDEISKRIAAADAKEK